MTKKLFVRVVLLLEVDVDEALEGASALDEVECQLEQALMPNVDPCAYVSRVSVEKGPDARANYRSHAKRVSKRSEGFCPWCGSKMEIGDEDPILERCCEDCASQPIAKLMRANPVMAERYRNAGGKW